MSAAGITSVVGTPVIGGVSLARLKVIVPDSVPPAPPANVPERSNVVMTSAFAAPTLRAKAQSAAASAVVGPDLKDIRPPPPLVIPAAERRATKRSARSSRTPKGCRTLGVTDDER